jgi:Uncharacterized protein conserved in bacteria
MNNSETEEPDYPSGSVYERCVREIESLHQFFEGWLSGGLLNTDEAFRRLDQALAPEFQLIHPSGEWRSRDDILTGLRQAYSCQPGLTIEIEDVRLRQEREELVVATYEEWQLSERKEGGRLSTVVFARRSEGPEGNPNGLRWLHVHETWLQEPGG